jgi:CRP-like cAMP-binding protein
MIEPETVIALREHPFLSGMTEQQLTELAECTQRVTFTAGQFLGRERAGAQNCYLIQSGHVAIEIQKPNQGAVVLQKIGPGEIVGWSWLLAPHRWQFDARVIEPIRALALDGKALIAKCDQDHELGYQLMRRLLAVISARLAAARHQLLEVHQ